MASNLLGAAVISARFYIQHTLYIQGQHSRTATEYIAIETVYLVQNRAQ